MAIGRVNGDLFVRLSSPISVRVGVRIRIRIRVRIRVTSDALSSPIRMYG